MRSVWVASIVMLACAIATADGGDSVDVIRGTDAAAQQSGVPRLKAQAVTVGPAVSVAVIRRIVRQKRAAFRLCYRSGLQKTPKLRGRITVEFVVDPSGAVTRATQTSSTTMPDASVVRCVVRSFDGLVFPRLSAGTLIVDYPLEFVP